jgi:hypothetical protein
MLLNLRGLGLLALPVLLMAAGPGKPVADASITPVVMDKTNSTGGAMAGSAVSADSSVHDSLGVGRPKSRSDSVIVVRHGFDHREQIIAGSVIMSCLVLMLVAMNNYNPR